MARLARMDLEKMIRLLMEKGIRCLTLELLKRQLDDEIDPDGLTTCPVCRALIDNLMAGGSPDYQVRINLKRPVIGIGAPIGFSCPRRPGHWARKRFCRKMRTWPTPSAPSPRM